MATTTTTSQIDPLLAPYLETGLEQAQNLFFGANQPQFFPGQTYVSPSQQTLQALQQQQALATQANPLLQQAQQAYQASLGQIGQTAAGAFLNANPYQQQMINAATRPLTQQFSNQILPGISSLYSKSGRLGSGAMESALGTASESYLRALGDVSGTIAGNQYQQNLQSQQQAQMQQAQLAAQAPTIYSQQFLPSQQLAQVGAAQEAIAAQPLQQQLAQYQFNQQLPYQQLQGYLSSVYGTPLGGYGTTTQSYPTSQNSAAGILGGGLAGGLGGYMLGSMLPSSFLGGYGGLAGGALGALGGGLLGGGLF
jgi:hypothetical protein